MLMTSHYDRAGSIIHDLERSEDKQKFLVGGIALFSAVSDMAEHFRTCGKPIISKRTRIEFGLFFEEQEDAYLKTDEEELIYKFFKITRIVADAGYEEGGIKFVKERLHLLGRFFEDGHNHDHRNECHLKMMGLVTENIFGIYENLRKSQSADA